MYGVGFGPSMQSVACTYISLLDPSLPALFPVRPRTRKKGLPCDGCVAHGRKVYLGVRTLTAVAAVSDLLLLRSHRVAILARKLSDAISRRTSDAGPRCETITRGTAQGSTEQIGAAGVQTTTQDMRWSLKLPLCC